MSRGASKVMQKEFEMSMLGELGFFLGLQISQKESGIFISQSKYIKEMLKKFQMEDSKPLITMIEAEHSLLQFSYHYFATYNVFTIIFIGY